MKTKKYLFRGGSKLRKLSQKKDTGRTGSEEGLQESHVAVEGRVENLLGEKIQW